MLKQDFPILQRKIHGKPLIYLDNAATTQKPEAVLKAMDNYYRTYNSNVHRGIYTLSEEATSKYEQVRDTVAKFLNSEREEIIFTKGTTDGLNMLANCLTETLKPGDEILLTEMEHHSNLVPWQQLAKKKKIVVKYIPLTKEGNLDFQAYKKILSKKTKIVSIIHISNVLGTINPIKEIAKEAHKVNALCIVDGAQSTPHMKVDVQDLDCDFFVFSGHKLLGPTGIGVVYGKRKILEKLEPYQYGGEMISKVTFQDSTWNELPWKFEAGTPAIAEAIGLGAAIEYITKIGFNKITKYQEDLTQYALQKLKTIPKLTIYGPRERGGVISFTIKNIHAYDVTAFLDKSGIAARSGTLCAMPLLNRLGIESVVRISFQIYNNKKEIDILLKTIKEIIEVYHD